MSYLRDWLDSHGIVVAYAKQESGIDGQVFDILLNGGKTVPGLALIIGHNLGMKPDEVRNLGITPDAHSRRDWNIFYSGNPWHLDAEWYNRVRDFRSDDESALIYGIKERPRAFVRQKNHVVKKPLHKREDYYGKGVCRYCGETFSKKAREQLYCSKRCATKDRRRLG